MFFMVLPKKLQKPNVFIRFGKRMAPGWLARPAGWNTRLDFHRFFMVFLQKHPKPYVFIRFGKRVAPGWLARPAGWNTRFDIQKASITLVFLCFTPKTSKNLMFSYVLGSGGSRLAGSAG